MTLSLRITAPLAGESAFGAEALFTASGRTITFPGFLRAYVETVDAEAGGEADDAERRLPNLTGRRAAAHQRADPGRPLDHPAGPLHRAVADQGAGGPGHRPAVDLHVDHPHHHRARLRLAQGAGAGPVVDRLRRRRAAGAALLPAGRLRLHRRDGGRTRRDRRRAGSAAPTGSPRFYFGGDLGPQGSVGRSGGLKKLVGERLEEIDAREVNSLPLLIDAQGRQVTVRVGRYGPYLERAALPSGGDGPTATDADPAARAGATCPRTWPPDEVTAEVAERLFEQAEIGDARARRRPGHPGT